MAATALLRASSRMSVKERLTPRAKSTFAVAKLMPEAAPVTAMTLSAREIIEKVVSGVFKIVRA